MQGGCECDHWCCLFDMHLFLHSNLNIRQDHALYTLPLHTLRHEKVDHLRSQCYFLSLIENEWLKIIFYTIKSSYFHVNSFLGHLWTLIVEFLCDPKLFDHINTLPTFFIHISLFHTYIVGYTLYRFTCLKDTTPIIS